MPYLQEKARTVLIDSDPNRSVCGWAVNGSLPFEVIPLHQAARRTREFEHVVIDTNAGLQANELKEIVEGCDLLIIPTTPDALSYQALMLTLRTIQDIKNAQYQVLLTIIPPRPSHVSPEKHCPNPSCLSDMIPTPSTCRHSALANARCDPAAIGSCALFA